MSFQYKYCQFVMFFIFMAGTFFLPSVAATEVVERILGIVNDELVLLTDLERDQVFCPTSPSMPPLGVSAARDEPYPGLQALINKRLVVSEARRLNISLPSKTVFEEARKTLIDRLGGLKSLTSTMAAHGMDQEDVLVMLRDHLLIRRFIEVRILPFVRTSSSDTVRDTRASQRLERYLSRLRARATIEINSP